MKVSDLNSTHVDLIFLDVEMDNLNGFHLLETLSVKPEIILTTAYDTYALKGYEFNVSDYLLKPYSFERFLQSTQKVFRKLHNSAKEVTPYVFIKTEYRLEKIAIDKILLIEGHRDYRQIHTFDKKIMTLENFKDLELILPSRHFCRVHKSYIVAINHIELIERDRIKIREHIIPVSDTYKENFYKLIRP